MKTSHNIEHVEFQLTYDNKDGAWFSIHVPSDDKKLFSGPIHVGMASQVLNLYRTIRDIEVKISASCDKCGGVGWVGKKSCESCNPLGV